MSTAYEEIIEFIAAGTPKAVVNFAPSQNLKDRVTELIELEKRSALSEDERSEPDHYVHLEHIMRLAKARARRRLAGKAPAD